MLNGYNGDTMYKAKPVIADKFWIVEQNGERVGTIHKGTDLTVSLAGKNVGKCSNLDELENKFNIRLVSGKELTVGKEEKSVLEVHGYPSKTAPFNAMYDMKRKLPLYTKTQNSQSFYCAGYYIIQFDKWLPSFCPKLLTLSRNEFKGPFKTKLEMQQVLKNT
jgi:hypothetical protein